MTEKRPYRTWHTGTETCTLIEAHPGCLGQVFPQWINHVMLSEPTSILCWCCA
jgi:hypothetical protein